MGRTLMAVILSILCPGLGQIYNRQQSKGWIIIGLTTLLVVIPSVWLMRQAAPLVQNADPLEIQSIMAKIVAENKHSLNFFSFTFLGLWAYSITQAYFKSKEISTPQDPQE